MLPVSGTFLVHHRVRTHRPLADHLQPCTHLRRTVPCHLQILVGRNWLFRLHPLSWRMSTNDSPRNIRSWLGAVVNFQWLCFQFLRATTYVECSHRPEQRAGWWSLWCNILFGTDVPAHPCRSMNTQDGHSLVLPMMQRPGSHPNKCSGTCFLSGASRSWCPWQGQWTFE